MLYSFQSLFLGILSLSFELVWKTWFMSLSLLMIFFCWKYYQKVSIPNLEVCRSTINILTPVRLFFPRPWNLNFEIKMIHPSSNEFKVACTIVFSTQLSVKPQDTMIQWRYGQVCHVNSHQLALNKKIVKSFIYLTSCPSERRA